jgi:uncharacterized protein YpmS
MIGLDLVFFTVFAANPMLSLRCLISVVRFSERNCSRNPEKSTKHQGFHFPSTTSSLCHFVSIWRWLSHYQWIARIARRNSLGEACLLAKYQYISIRVATKLA